MGCRATEAQVKAIMQTALEESALTPFITMANSLVTSRLVGYYETDHLDQIEIALSAFFAVGKDPAAGGVTSESIGPVSQSYGGASGLNLDSNRFGVMVKMLDYKGILSKVKTDAEIVTLG